MLWHGKHSQPCRPPSQGRSTNLPEPTPSTANPASLTVTLLAVLDGSPLSANPTCINPTGVKAVPSMPSLEDITYSRDETVAAFTSYYDFLVKMYLGPEEIITPPEGGWPEITTETLAPLSKSDEVVALLRELPYVRRGSDDGRRAQGAPYTLLADWNQWARSLRDGRNDAESIRIVSEGSDNHEHVPAHVFGLTSAGAEEALFLLDTRLGTVDYPDAWDEVCRTAGVEPVKADWYDLVPEEEIDTWRQCAWAIPDFFELLKEQFRLLRWIPISPKLVIDVFTNPASSEEGMIEMLRGIYREHGWPDLEAYRKEECLAAVKQAMKEHYPDSADPLDDYNDSQAAEMAAEMAAETESI